MKARPVLVGALAAALALVAASPARGEALVRAFVDPPAGITDTRPFRLVIQVDGSTDAAIEALPPLRNLRIVSGPAVSTQTSIQLTGAGMERRSVRSLTYTLVALAPGTAQIPALPVKVEGRVIRTEPIRLEIVAGARSERSPGPARADDSSNEDLVLDARLGSSAVWLGQPVPLTVTLYSPVQIRGASFTRTPELSGFWKKDVPEPGSPEVVQRDGGRTIAYPLFRTVLVPSRTGDLVIEPFAGQFQFRSLPRDPFTDLFRFGRTDAVVRASRPLRLQVRALPAEGRPPEFAGAVGRFRLRSGLDRTALQLNEAAAFRVTIEGEGLLETAPAPPFDPPPELKAFEPKVTASSSVVGGRLVSSKSWEWALVPLAPGRVEVPEVRFAYFDPAEGRYATAVEPPRVLEVTRSAGAPDPGAARADLRPFREDIAYLKHLDGPLARGSVPLHRRPLFLAGLGLPVLLVPAAIVLGRRRGRRGDPASRAGRARSQARRRLRHAARGLGPAGAEAFHQEVARALVDYVADRFDRSSAGLTYDVADGLLEGAGVPADLRRRYRTVLETCDFARFVPASAEASRQSEVLRDAAEVLERLERAR